MTPEEIAQALPAFVTNSGLPPPDVTTALTLQAARETIPRLLDVAGGPGPVHQWIKYTHPSAGELGKLLDDHGSDKANGHNYHHFYAYLLGARRYEYLRLLEVGLGSPNLDVTGNMGAGARAGASLRAWRDFLPNAQIFGADIDRRVLFAEDRISTFFVDQTDPSSFVPVGHSVEKLDFIIDDGLHSPHTNLATLAFAIRMLRPTGWVVIEDIRAASVPIWHLAAKLLPARWASMVIQADAGFHLFAATAW